MTTAIFGTIEEAARQAAARYPGVVLLFRERDQYIVPVVAHQQRIAQHNIPAAFPASELEWNLRKLLRAKVRVAICAPND